MNVRLVMLLGFVFAVALPTTAAFDPSAISTRQARVDAQKSATHYAAHSHTRILRASSLTWQPEKSLPPGAESVVLEGDPSKPGLVILRLKMPNGYRVPPVWHPAADRFTVLSGTYHLGVGAKFDKSKTVALSAGDFVWLNPAAPHYGWCTGETVLEITGLGPFITNPVNSREAPALKHDER